MADTEVFVKEVMEDGSVVVVRKEVGPPSMNPTSSETEYIIPRGHTVIFPARNVCWGPDGYVRTGRVVITNDRAFRQNVSEAMNDGRVFHPPVEWFD